MNTDILEFRGKNFYLSNFHFSDITYNNKIWRTSEHLFQAIKTLDMDKREYIRNLEKPGDAKREGRLIELRYDWEEIKDDVMYECIHRKFTQNELLKIKLLHTYPAFLCEGNYHHDNYWGDCLCPKCQDEIGINKLGQLLMKLRSHIGK